MTLDAISASNMRHVVSQIAPKAADLIQQQQATIERLSAEKAELLNDIAVMMSEFVDNWPQPKKVSTALALIAKTLRTTLNASTQGEE
jgi:cell division protein FtsB